MEREREKLKIKNNVIIKIYNKHGTKNKKWKKFNDKCKLSSINYFLV